MNRTTTVQASPSKLMVASRSEQQLHNQPHCCSTSASIFSSALRHPPDCFFHWSLLFPDYPLRAVQRLSAETFNALRTASRLLLRRWLFCRRALTFPSASLQRSQLPPLELDSFLLPSFDEASFHALFDGADLKLCEASPSFLIAGTTRALDAVGVHWMRIFDYTLLLRVLWISVFFLWIVFRRH